MDSPNKTNQHHWGQSQHLHMTETLDLAIARGKAGGRSSMHTHQNKRNWFLVVEGCVRVVECADGGEYSFDLRPGHAVSVPPGIPHRMEFVTDATLYELYTAAEGQTVDLADIQRFDEGRGE
ncbi:MAG: cupin domain-containing protein [Planctomycetaceae bacterium]